MKGSSGGELSLGACQSLTPIRSHKKCDLLFIVCVLICKTSHLVHFSSQSFIPPRHRRPSEVFRERVYLRFKLFNHKGEDNGILNPYLLLYLTFYGHHTHRYNTKKLIRPYPQAVG